LSHAAIENSFSVRPTIVAPIQANDGLVQVESDILGDVSHLRQNHLQQEPFLTIPSSQNKWDNHITVVIAETPMSTGQLHKKIEIFNYQAV
jgi:hypothetical protein